ncbi:type II secretion system protein J [Thermotoga sp. KOL6]|uniref:PulJ/GspJ family protein n=1 Tax=Thermotoga sp. KOL6 TaxID=126741 RepID=UPI000C7628B1|nr:prepilin-type N-terminal cleavage/methylation domain-containing protein [Thermotoga sp. KOL6]PLV59861.1 hypothetical protein AS005_00745 [Thermotoga sp. KOL6]
MKSGFTITEMLITMTILLTVILFTIGLLGRAMITTAQSITVVELSDDLLKTAMELRKEIIKAGPRVEKINVYPDKVEFFVNVPFGDENYYPKEYKYSIIYRDSKIEIWKENEKKVIATDISTCTFYSQTSSTVSFFIGKKKNNIERVFYVSVSLPNVK